MAVRFQTTFKNENGDLYLVRIHDDDFAGTATAFTTTSCKITYTTDGKDDERFAPILVSELKLGIKIDSATLETFVEDLIDAAEGRFYVVVTDLFNFTWNGYILMDLVSIEDAPLAIGYVFEIRAKDGLNRLKNIDYNNAGTAYTGYETFVTHVLNCLNKIEFVSTLWPGGTDLLNVVCNWHENSYTYASTINPLARSRVNHRAFYYVDTRGNYVYKSGYEVLEEICKAWGCRLMLSGTAFWLVQLNELDNAASVRVFSYEADGTATSATADLTIDHVPNGSTDLIRLSPGRFEFYRGLRYARVDYQHIATRNLLAGQVWDTVFDSVVTVEDIDSNSGESALSFEGSLSYNSTWFSFADPFQEHFLVFAFTIKVGTWHYKRNLTVYSGGGWAYDTPAWVDTGADNWDWRTPGTITSDKDGVTIGPITISFFLEALPADDDLEITFDLVGAYAVDGTALSITGGDPGVVVTYSLDNNYLELVATGLFADQNDINRYQSTNDANASGIIELETLIGDGPSKTSPGHIEVQDDTTAWVVSDAWRVGNSGTYKAHSQLLANEIIRGQLTPVRKFAQVPFQMVNPTTAPMAAHKAMVYDSARWVFQGGIWDLQTRIWTGNWWKLQSASGYTEEDIEYIPKDSASGPPTTGGSSGTGGGGGGGGTVPPGNTVNRYRQAFTASGSATFTVTAGGGTLPTNLNHIDVWYNGQLISENIDSVDGPAGELTLDTTPLTGAQIVIVWYIIE